MYMYTDIDIVRICKKGDTEIYKGSLFGGLGVGFGV